MGKIQNRKRYCHRTVLQGQKAVRGLEFVDEIALFDENDVDCERKIQGIVGVHRSPKENNICMHIDQEFVEEETEEAWKYRTIAV